MSDEHLTHLLWLDLETTGLSRTSPIIEVGAVLTNMVLEKRGQFARLILDPDEVGVSPSDFGGDENGWRMAAVDELTHRADDYVKTMHESTGLWDDLRAGKGVVDLTRAETDLLEWLDHHEVDRAILCGTGVEHFDRPLIERDWPRLTKRLHYGGIDIGSDRRFIQHCVSAELAAKVIVPSERPHRALDDARGALRSAHRLAAVIAAGRRAVE